MKGNPLFDIIGPGIQNGPLGALMSLKQFFTTGDPTQAVQACLLNGRINQQQAELLNNAITNGNAEQIVRNMISSGQMSQEQFNTMSMMAQQFQGFLK